MKSHYDFVIVGSGAAGRTAVETLVTEAPESSVLLVDSESRLPYKRTRVSKQVASGKPVPDVHPASWYEDAGIHLALGEPVREILPNEQSLTLGPHKIGYGALLLAVGASPKQPFDSSELILPLWTPQDAGRLNRLLDRSQRILVAGSGVLGVEAAWQAVLAGKDVVLAGDTSLPMSRFLDKALSEHLNGIMTDAGVRLELCESVAELHEQPSGGVRARLKGCDGEHSLDVDAAVVAVGSLPNTDLARRAGLNTRRGICVDSSLKSSNPHIWAAGDCAEHPGDVVTGLWHAAEHQGKLAAMSMLGHSPSDILPPFRLKCEVFNHYYFSGGPLAAPVSEELPQAQTWNLNGILWRARFNSSGRLKALGAASPGGMDKNLARAAQKQLTEEAGLQAVKEVLSGPVS